MINRIVFATGNPAKIKEMQAFIDQHHMPIKIISQRNAGIIGEAVEDGETFTENSKKKALFAAEKLDDWVIAEDAGMCVSHLDGAPGVYSARFAGVGASAQEIVDKTIVLLEGVPASDRGAYFECVFTLMSPQGEVHQFAGRTDGIVSLYAHEEYDRRFPYDAVFIPKGSAKTYGEMTHEEKNACSHRGKALRKLNAWLKDASSSDSDTEGTVS